MHAKQVVPKLIFPLIKDLGSVWKKMYLHHTFWAIMACILSRTQIFLNIKQKIEFRTTQTLLVFNICQIHRTQIWTFSFPSPKPNINLANTKSSELYIIFPTLAFPYQEMYIYYIYITYLMNSYMHYII